MKNLILLCLLLGSGFIVRAQQVTQANVPAPGSTIYQLNLLPGSMPTQASIDAEAGNGVIWDYSAAVIDSQNTIVKTDWKTSSATPFSGFAPNAQYISHYGALPLESFISTEISPTLSPAFDYQYVRADASGLYLEGDGLLPQTYVLAGDVLSVIYQYAAVQSVSPTPAGGELVVPFPLSYGVQTNTQSYTANITGRLTVGGLIDSVEVDRIYDKDFVVDGRGTLITPNGTYQNVLRLKTTHTETNNFYRFPLNTARPATPDSVRHYTLITYSFFDPNGWEVFSIQTGANQTVNPNATLHLNRVTVFADTMPSFTFEANEISYEESVGTVQIPVNLTIGMDNNVSVDYTINAGSATSPADYSANATGTLIFAPGQSTQSISVQINNDITPEQLESFSITLSNPGAGTGIAIGQLQVNIVDDDRAIIRFGLKNGQIDTLVNEGGQTISVPIELVNGQTAQQVFIEVKTSERDATDGADYLGFSQGKTVILQPGMNMVPVFIDILEDNLNEVDEHFTLFITGVSPSDSAVVGFSDSLRVFINDNDFKPSIQFEVDRVNLFEHTNELYNVYTVTVNLSRAFTWPNQSVVSVDFQTIAGTAVSPLDYADTSGVLIFQPGESVKTFQVRVFNNLKPQDTKFFRIALSNVQGDAQLGEKVLLQVNLSNNDLLSRNDEALHFSLYPNPTSGMATIQLQANQNAVERITVSNLTGQIVQTIENPIFNNGQFAVDFSALPAGFYQIALHANGTLFTQKVVKN